MTRTPTCETSILRSPAPFIGVLIVLLALAALAQTRGGGQMPQKSGLSDYSVSSGPRLFVPAVAYDSGGYTGTSIAVGDLNVDGKLDLVVGNKCGDSGCQVGIGSVGVRLGNGDGTFQAVKVYSSGGFFADAVAIGDLNGDHKPDLVVSNVGSNTVGVLLGNGDGTFQPAVIYGSGAMFPTSVAVADMNDDGRPDILVTNACSDSNCDGSVGVLLGNGDGTFQSAVTYRSGGNTAVSVAVADVNHDGKPDLLIANDCAGSCSPIVGGVAVLLGNGDGTFQAATSYDSGGTTANSVAVADVNGDGNMDLMVSNLDLNTVGVLLGNGDGTFRPAVTYGSNPGSPASVASSVAVADVNGDGKPDLLVVNQSVGGDGFNNGAVAVLLGNGDGTFQTAVNYLSGGYQTLRVVVGDVNGDGRPDLLVANQCSSNLGVNCGGPINLITGSAGVLLNNVGAPPTTTSLASSVNPADINGLVTYTAAVTGPSGVLKGTVLFQDGATPIATVPVIGNHAAYSTTYAAPGTHSITAIYSGVLNIDAGSTSEALTETIVRPHPSNTQVTTSGSPTLVGQPVTFTAKVTSTSGPIPDGELVTFYDGPTAIGSNATTSGTAAFTTSMLSARTHAIKAIYAGDVNFKVSSGTVLQVVNTYPTTTKLTSTPNPSQFGQAVTFATHVTSTGPAPTGSVKFLDGTTGIAFAALNGGVATLTKSNLAVGMHAITAQYVGDPSSDKSTSPVLNQDITTRTSKTVLSTSKTPSLVGQLVTFTARVTSIYGTIPNGELVTFYDGSTAIATNTTKSGLATFVTSSLTARTHTIKATYAGDANTKPSSGAVAQVVNKYPTTAHLTSTPNPSQLGQIVTFSAHVTSTGPTPTGNVAFFDGTTGIGLAPLSGGVAQLSKSNLAVGTHAITAHYKGDAASSTSTSAVLSQTVK